MPVEAEWLEWEAPSGILPLQDGRRVFVQCGDLVLFEIEDDVCRALDHQPASRH